MIRRLTLVTVASIAAIGAAGTAVAASGHAATTYKASLAAVNPAATTAGIAGVVGRAQLVDGRNNKVSLHMRHLAANTTYLWHVHVGTCAATGAPVAGWTYRTHDAAGDGTLTTNDSGNANTKGKSATFNADPGPELLGQRARCRAHQRPGRRHDHRLRRLEDEQGQRQEQAQAPPPTAGPGTEEEVVGFHTSPASRIDQRAA